ncbi:hypothetical protein OKW24_001581 [Peribacillus simplex]|uniref:hypothetical protein n=1 Tax=Peribacillus simplex TaxID=1478 RepID=UPI0024E2251C|nr:hypothetical protein [Peribacillus simplex]MDF9759808.1 hypothetical protein [Peribacillus simplex]
MRLKKWMLLVGYMCLFLGFGYSGYSIFVDETGSNFWIMWGIASLVMGYQVINFLVKKKTISGTIVTLLQINVFFVKFWFLSLYHMFIF